jgi:NADH-quinone oxidoreductase subunit M
MGGLWSTCPRMGGIGMVLAMASLGLPGLGNFVGEFLVLLGTWQIHSGMAIAAAMGFVFSAAYSLVLMQKIFHGPLKVQGHISDFGFREMAIMGLIATGLIGLGVYPQPVLDAAKPAIQAIQIQLPTKTERVHVDF